MKNGSNHGLILLVGVVSLVVMSASFAQSVAPQGDLDDSKRYIFDRGFIFGRVFDDRDGDGRSNFRERGIQRVTVYLDENDNGVREPGERFTQTDRWGFYYFAKVPSGDYAVRQEVPFGWRNISGGEGEVVTPTVVQRDSGGIIPQIIGGDEVNINEYPFMVAVGVVNGGQFRQFCGGVLITDRWVATAAHCSEGASGGNVNVLVGTNNVEDGSGQVLDVADVLLHPDYILEPTQPGSPAGVSGGYDIALWELGEPIALRDSGLQTVAMLTPKNKRLADDGKLATAVGWGTSNLQSNLLQDVHLPVFDSAECAAVYSGAINFETQICGGAPEGGIDACQGDSGGPLLVRDFRRERWKLAGVTSYGNGCALPGNPGVWARVSELSQWAKDTAVEQSRVHRVSVRPFGFVRASFGNRSTRFEPRAPIEPRWQLVNADVENNAEQGLTFDWRIIDESSALRTFDCVADGDGPAPQPGVEVPCFAGINQVSLPPLEDGVYTASLGAAFEDARFSRITNFISGMPEETSIGGALTTEDIFDPDYQANYYIDYFDLDGLPEDRAIALRIESVGLNDLFVALYNRDIREAQGFGGELQAASAFGIGEAAVIFIVPEVGVNYLLGVSSFSSELVGEYRVSVINGGSAVPTSLEAPVVPGIDRRGLRKIPEVKTVVSYPIID
ncbi:trypsin-like serine protease [Exilibacterium tricleocarpae]|uniref:Trypsin-like serine protease n=1 Tax=Exilibacterium tricleocarpae TaxID=2591008 RepID=A0A545TAC7_9GAMM|nr:trypsin-like serine protease [Exilibacterium tricleocarpae]TQV74170.1 trypsin-like serine protease [Exilibacterium tricleocarpae]